MILVKYSKAILDIPSYGKYDFIEYHIMYNFYETISSMALLFICKTFEVKYKSQN